jgi:cytochrome c oxidase assembly protein subunit 15
VKISPERFRLVALVALVSQCAIVVSGGGVRLTDSGLGCSSWPNCEPGHLVAPLGFHHWVEFGNRLLSSAVVAIVIATLIAAMRRTPRRRDLTLLSAGLVGGVLAQVVLGGLTVYYDLRPGFVMAHFLLSMLLVLDAAVLLDRSTDESPTRSPAVRSEVGWLTRSIAALGAVVLVLGTVVTGTGPHSGDKVSSRFDLSLRNVSQLHADVVMVLVGATIALGFLLAATDAPRRLRTRYRVLVAIVLAQASIGFTQYALHVPAGLVEVHILGATLFWLAAVRVDLATRDAVAVTPAPVDPTPVDPTPVDLEEINVKTAGMTLTTSRSTREEGDGLRRARRSRPHRTAR